MFKVDSEFQLAFLCLTIQSIYLVGESDLLAQKKSIIYSSLSLITLFISLSLNIFFLVVLKMGVYGILLSMLVAKSVNAIIVLYITLRKVPLKFCKVKLGRMVRFGLPLIPAALAMFAMHSSDRFFVQKYCDLNELGLYSLGYKFGTIISVLIMVPIFQIWNTQRFEIAKQSDAGSIYAKVFTWFVFILVFAGLGISLFVDEVVQLMTTSAYAGSSNIVPLIVVSYIMFSISGFFTLGNMITGHTKVIATNHILAAIFNLILNYFLINHYGVWGAAWSTVLSFSVLAFLNYISSQREVFVPIERARILILFMVAGGLYLCVSLLPLSFIWLLLVKSVSIFLFPLILLMAGFFPVDELNHAKIFLKERFPIFSRG